LRGGDDVNAGLTPALRQARQWFSYRLAAHHQQVGQFINDDHDAGSGAVPAFHQAHQTLQRLGHLLCVPDNSSCQVGQTLKETKSVAFGIYQHHAQPGAVVLPDPVVPATRM
jgi:hypothetical protein